MDLRDGRGRAVALGEVLGEGGEGTVYRLHGNHSLVGKVYHPALRTPEREAKVLQMCGAPPADPLAPRGRVSLAWPRGALYEAGAFVGFTMPSVDVSRAFALHQLWKAKQRPAGCTYTHLLRVASNLCAVTQALHVASYVLGDVNESNFLVTDRSLVVAVDLDSIQVPGPGGRTFRCLVHKPEFSPPELHSGFDLRRQDRTPEQDRFGLAVLVWELLMLGRHPFAGGKPQIATNIREGVSWALDPARPAPAGAPPLETLPPNLLPLARAAFGPDPVTRPEAMDWHRELTPVLAGLRTCRVSPQHTYGGHLSACPWCAYQDRWSYDPFDPSSTRDAYARSRRGNRKLAEQWSQAKSSALHARLSGGGAVAAAPSAPSAPGTPIATASGIEAHLPRGLSAIAQGPGDYTPRSIPRWVWGVALGVGAALVFVLLTFPFGSS